MPPRVHDANVILDLAIHDVDVFHYLLGAGEPDDVFCNAGKAVNGDLFDYADVFLRFGKVGCLLQANWMTPVKIRSLSATGTRGYAELEYVRQELDVYPAAPRRGPVVRPARATRGRARADRGRARRAAAARARRLRARRRRRTGRGRVRRRSDRLARGRRDDRRRGGAGLMDPLVSIPILCHDYGRFLPEAIESALAQSYARVEVVVWDDGSTDDTRDVAALFEVELVSQENVGLVRTCNRAVTAARGE